MSMRSIAHHEATRRGLNTVAMTSSVDLIADDDMEGAVAAEERLRMVAAKGRGCPSPSSAERRGPA